MKNHIYCLLFFAVLITAGCVRTARLYPANDLSNQEGVLTANFKSYGTGHGSIEILATNGEVFNGEYSIVRGGAIGFGSVYASVYGPGGSAGGYGTGVTQVTPGGSPGTASAYSNKQRSMLCEFYNDNFSGHGHGACRRSDGALYRLQY